MPKNKNISDVDLIRNYPKDAINKLSIPIIISLLLITFNALIDSAWVSGLGTNALAAMGFVAPLMLFISSLGNGLGIGTNSVISRAIGENNADKISNSAVHSIILTIVVSLIFSGILISQTKNILMFLGAGSVIDYASPYASVFFAGIILEYIPIVLAAIIRSEGAVNKAMGPLIGGTIINIIIDPIFIYYLNLGISGAALATVLSSAISIIPLAYWIFIKKSTYAKVDFGKFHNDLSIYKDILIVGIPASLEAVIISIVTIFINSLLAGISGNIAVAAYGVGMRIISVLNTPISGIGVANITVVGAAFGAKNKENMETAFKYSTKITFIIAIFTFLAVIIFAGNLAHIFANGDSPALEGEIIKILYIFAISVFSIPLRAVVYNILQAMGKGITSALFIVFKESVFTICSFVFAFYLNLGPDGIYYGMLTGGMIGSAMAFIYVWNYIRKLSFDEDIATD